MADAPAPLRLTPFDLVFGVEGAPALTTTAEAIMTAGTSLADRDALLLDRAFIGLLRDLRPDDGLGDAADEFVAFVHHALAWRAHGAPVTVLDEAGFQQLTTTSEARTGAAPVAHYIALPERRCWGAPVPDAPHEPLDGLHLLAAADGTLRVLGCFGVHAQRLGLTVVEVQGPPPEPLAREDGTPLFAPRLAGGRSAGLAEVIGDAELLALGWRAAMDLQQRSGTRE